MHCRRCAAAGARLVIRFAGPNINHGSFMKNPSLGQWIEKELAERPIRANSLIITIYGDMISTHGGTVWLGSFIKLVEPFGINARMVRTNVFRLSAEKWLIAEKIGRRSYYSLTASGKRRFEHAHRRIYDEAHPAWQGEWLLVVIPSGALKTAQREALRKDLIWEGYGSIAPGVMVCPSTERDSLLDLLQTTGMHDRVVTIQGQTLGALAGKSLKEMVGEGWNLARLAREYRGFTERFRSVARTLNASPILEPQQCFMIRTLLMHEFRRVQLRDPLLPRQLLPDDWPGDTARGMCREIYMLCQQKTEEHLMTVLETADGPLPPAAPDFYGRFGGIAKRTAVNQRAV
jgi:phenylacetic acid degradation operon negative regulatory protein